MFVPVILCLRLQSVSCLHFCYFVFVMLIFKLFDVSLRSHGVHGNYSSMIASFIHFYWPELDKNSFAVKLFKKNSKIKVFLENYLLVCYFVCLCECYYYNNIQRRNKEIMILELHHLGLPWDWIKKNMWKLNLIMRQKQSFVLQIFL